MHVAWPSCAWLLLSFCPYPVGHPEHEQCNLYYILFFAPVCAVHVAALVAVEGPQLCAVLYEGARDGGGVGPAPLQLRVEHAGVEVVQLLQVPEDGGRGVGGHAQLVPVEYTINLR